MSDATTLTDKQERIMAAVKEKKDDPSLTLVSLSKKYNVARTTLRRACNTEGNGSAILQMSAGRGRKTRLRTEEENLIANAILDFQNNGTPLARDAVRDLAQTFVNTLPPARRLAINFHDDRPGRDWLSSFLQRRSDLTLKSRVNLEHDRADAMNPENCAKHFARIKALCDKHGINDGCYIFNLDESGFSMRGMTLGGRTKCVVQRGTRANTREVKFRGTVDHVTLMPVVSGSGHIYTPLFVLPGVKAKWRKVQSGGFETPADFLPSPNYMFMREVAGVDSEIFFSWALHFVEETRHLRRGGQKLLLVFDGYAGHIRYKTLSLLRSNGIIVAGLPAHTSHVLQPLDVGVFSSCKENFRKLLCTRSITSKRNVRNDIFTICELLSKAYHMSVTSSNVMGGFRRSGLWVQEKRGPDPSQIRAEDFTSSAISNDILEGVTATRSRTTIMETSSTAHSRVENYQQLCALFLTRAEELCSDGAIVLDSGTIKVSTKSGATLTSDNVIAALQHAEEKKEQERQRKKTAAIEKEKRQAARDLALAAKRSAQKEREKRNADKEEVELLKLKARRASREAAARASRDERRRRAKLRARAVAGPAPANALDMLASVADGPL